MIIASASGSMAVRLTVTPVAMDGGPDEQEQAIRKGLSSAVRLLEWYTDIDVRV